MFNKIIKFSIENKIVVGFLTLLLVVFGLYSTKKIPLDAVPDITNNQVQIITVSASLAPQEVEKMITYPVELSMANIPNVVDIRSISRFGLSVVTVVFEEGVDIMRARQFVNEQITEAIENIPSNLGVPKMMPITTGLGEIYQYVLKVKPGYYYPSHQLRSIQDWIVKRRISGTEGVIEVSSYGGKLKQYEISIDPNNMNSLGISLHQISEVLKNNNENQGAGYIEKNSNAYYIRTEGLLTSVEDIENITVVTNKGVPIKIRDVATVKIGSPTRFGAMTKDGKGEIVGGIVLMFKGENSSAVIQRVKEKVADIQNSLPKGIVIESYLDRSALVKRTTSTVAVNLIEGALIVIFILVLLLGNFRAGLIVASVIPLSLLFAICMMNLFGVSANLMSLGAIDFGLVADGAIILVEAIVHYLYIGKSRVLTQKEMDEAVFKSSSKVRKSSAFGEIIILIVYLPLLALVGIEGKMFKPMAQTVSFAILGALILSLTYVPMMSALFLNKKIKIKTTLADKIINRCKKFYEPILLKSLQHKKKLIISVCLAFGISIYGFYKMGGEFIPTLEEGDMALQISSIPGTSLTKSIEITTKVEKILLENFPEVKSVVSKIGAAEIPTDPMGIQNYDIMIIMKDKSEWVSAKTREDLAGKMKAKLENIVGINIEVTQPIQLRFNELISGVKSDIAVKIYGEDMQILAEKAAEIEQIIKGTEGIADMQVEQISGLQQYILKYNRDRMAQYGVTVAEVNDLVNTAYYGKTVGTMFENERKFDIVVRLNQNSKRKFDLTNLFIYKNGLRIPVDEFVDFSFQQGPLQISRENTRRKINIGINVRDRDVESLVNEIKTKIETNLKLPTGYYIGYGGQFENLKEAKKRLSIAVPIALALILFLLYITFGSLKYTLLIFSAVPLSAIGGILALYLRDMPFSISAGIGFIALFGVAVLNGIVLISYFNQLRKEYPELTIQQIVIKGALERLRPVIMTAMVASFGFLPMAISTSSGAEVQKPLATVVIGGLFTATILTLLVLPCIYIMIDKVKKLRVNLGVIILLFLGLGVDVNAQNNDKTILTEKKALSFLKQNTVWKNINLDYEKQLSEKGEIVDIGDTEIFYRNFQDLPNNNLTILGVRQNLGSLYTHIAKGIYTNEKIKYSKFSLQKKQKDLQTLIRIVYNEWHQYFIKKNLTQNKLDILKSTLEISRKKYEQKSISMSDYNLAKMKFIEAKSDFLQAQKEYRDITVKLKKMLNIKFEITPGTEVLKKLKFTIAPKDSVINEMLKLPLDQQIQVVKQKHNLALSKFFPSLYVEYNHINRESVKTFAAIQFGVTIPLWFLPQKSRVSQMRIEVEKTKNRVEQELLNLQENYKKAKQEYLHFAQQTKDFEGNLLENSKSYYKQINVAFELGEISLYEFIQRSKDYYDFLLKKNEMIKGYNESVINLEYFY